MLGLVYVQGLDKGFERFFVSTPNLLGRHLISGTLDLSQSQSSGVHAQLGPT